MIGTFYDSFGPSGVADYLDEWHEALNENRGDSKGCLGLETAQLRAKLIEEESSEAIEAIETNNDVEHIAKELADVVYVCYGAARAYGIPLDLAIEEVHKSNMTKLIGGPVRRADGKLLKGEHFKEADMRKVMENA